MENPSLPHSLLIRFPGWSRTVQPFAGARVRVKAAGANTQPGNPRQEEAAMRVEWTAASGVAPGVPILRPSTGAHVPNLAS